MKLKALKLTSWFRLMAVTIGMTVSFGATAQIPFPEGGDLEVNVEYLVTKDNVVATFVPTQTAEITYICGNVVIPYSDIEHTSERTDRVFQNNNQLGTFSLQVEENVPVYFYVFDDPSWYSDVIFKISADEPIVFVYGSAVENSVLSLTSGMSDLTFTFNQPVKVGSAFLFGNGVMRPAKVVTNELSGSEYSMNVNINYLSPLQELFDNNVLKGLEEIKVILSDIENSAGVKYEGEDGGSNLVLNYKAPSKPVALEELVVPEVFDGNWSKGDPNALVTATYSGNISKAQYTLTYGLDPDSTMPTYYEEIGISGDPSSKSPVNIDGNKVSIDFSTVKRSPTDMGFESNEIYVKIAAWDESGQPVIGEGQGNVGSKEVVLPYIYHQLAAFKPVYTPASGTSLSGVKELKLQYENYTDIDFTGIDFIITDGETINVPKSDTSHQELNDDKWSVVYTIPVPEAVQKADTNVRVKLTGATSLTVVEEGLADEFDAIYFPKQLETTDDFDVMPVEGTVEQLLDFEVGCEGFEVSIVADGTSQIILSVTENEKTEEIRWFGISDVTIESGVAKFSLPVAISEAGDYTLTIPEGFFSFNSGSAESMLNGMREVSYKIGESDPVQLPLNSMYFVNPDEGDVENLSNFEIGCQNYVTSITEDQNQKIVLNRVENENQTVIEEFTKESITIGNGTAKFTLNTPLTEDGVYELLIPEGFFTFTNESLESTMLNSGKEITYRIASKVENLEYEATPTPGVVAKLSEISLYFPNGAALGEGNAEFLIDDQDPIILNGEMSWAEDLSDPSSTIKFTLPEEYTTDGTYVLHLPDGYVLDANGNASGEYRLEYKLDKMTGISMPVIPDSIVDVYTIEGVKIIEGGTHDFLMTLPSGLYIINGKKIML